MPFGDGTGPLGQGPRRGRGAGFCGADRPGNLNSGWDRGMGRCNRGAGGRGWRHYFHATGPRGWQRAADTQSSASVVRSAMPSEQEIAVLKGEAESLEAALGQVHQRIEELEAKLKHV